MKTIKLPKKLEFHSIISHSDVSKIFRWLCPQVLIVSNVDNYLRAHKDTYGSRQEMYKRNIEIVELRNKNLTQEKIAKRFGITKQAVSLILRKYEPSSTSN